MGAKVTCPKIKVFKPLGNTLPITGVIKFPILGGITDYIVILTARPSTLRCRPEPVPEESLQLYTQRIQTHLQALNDSKGILKINGISTLETVIKKIGAFIALKNRGYQNCGKRLSDTRSILEVSTTTG